MTISNIFNNLFKIELFPTSNRSKHLTKLTKKAVSSEEKEKQLLLFRLNDTKIKLYIVENAFNNELKFDLIDSYIHEINSLRVLHSHLFKQAKHLQITSDYQIKEDFY